MTSSPNPRLWNWSYTLPQLPSDRSLVKAWLIGEQNIRSIQLAPDNVLLGIFPNQVFSGQIDFGNIQIPCPFVAIGGHLAPDPKQTASAYGQSFKGLQHLFKWRMRRNTPYRGGRLWSLISHLYVDWQANNTVWANFLRAGVADGAHPSHYPQIYLQNIFFNGGCIGFDNDRTVEPALAADEPNSSIFRGGHGHWQDLNIGRCRFSWRGYGLLTRPPSKRAYRAGQRVRVRDTACYASARPSYHPPARKFEWIKPRAKEAFNYQAGKYPAFDFDNTYFVIDPEQADPLTYFSPTSGIGGQVSYDAATGRYGFPTQAGGNNADPVYSGACYAVPRGQEPTLLRRNQTGFPFRVDSVAKLYQAFGQ